MLANLSTSSSPPTRYQLQNTTINTNQVTTSSPPAPVFYAENASLTEYDDADYDAALGGPPVDAVLTTQSPLMSSLVSTLANSSTQWFDPTSPNHFGVVWNVHVVGFGVCFCLSLPLVCLLQRARQTFCSCPCRSPGSSTGSSPGESSKRVCVILLICCLVAFTATLRGVTLLIDPYGTTRLLPPRFVRVSGAILHPSYITAVYFLQYALHLATKVNLVLSSLHNPYFIGVMVFAHFGVTFANEFVPPNGKAAFAMVFMKAFFIFWCYFIDAMFFAFCLKVRSYLDEVSEDIRSWQLRSQLAHGPYSSTSVPICKHAKQPAQVISKHTDMANGGLVNAVRILHAKYFGTCGDNAVYTGMDEVDYDNLVVSISDLQCSVSFSAKADRHFMVSTSTTTTSLADRLSFHSTSDLPYRQSAAQISNLSPLSSDMTSRNGDLSSDSTLDRRRRPDEHYDYEETALGHLDDGHVDQSALAQQHADYSSGAVRYNASCNQQEVEIVPAVAPAGFGFHNSVTLSRRCLACTRILRFGYVTSLTVFLLCVLQTYAIFGAYNSGLYELTTTVNINSWITFQTLHRFVELLNTQLLIGILMAIRRFGFMRVKKI